MKRPEIAAVIAVACALGCGVALAGTWLAPPGDLSEPASSNSDPAVAMTPTGEATVAWTRATVGVEDVVQAVRQSGGAWGARATLSAAGGDISEAPRVAVDASGAATVVWSREPAPGSAHEVQAARFVNGAWTPAVALGTSAYLAEGGAVLGPDPDVAADAAGGTTAVWRRYDGTAWTVMAASANGASWGSAAPLAPAAPSIRDLQVVAGAPGTATAAWVDVDPAAGASELRVAHLEDGAWSAPRALARQPGDLRIAGSAAGAVVATWEATAGGVTVVMAARFDGRSWGPAVQVSDASQDAILPVVAMDGSGVATIMWRQADGAGTTLWAARSGGSAWGAPERAATGAMTYSPLEVSAAQGAVTALYHAASNADPGPLMAVNFGAGRWQASVQLAASGMEPAAASDAAGSALATWRTSSGPFTVQAIRFINSPSAPRGATAAAGQERATVSWSAPISDGGAPVTSYTATASPGGKTCTASATSGCTVEGLTGGTAYTFTVTATNAQGTSPASDPSAAVTPTAAPAPTTKVRKLGAKYRLGKRTLTTLGRVPAGATSVIQSATTARKKIAGMTEHAGRARTARGTCRIRTTGTGKARTRTFTCTLKFTAKGRWTVTTTARKRSEAVARATRVVTVRK